MSDPKDPNRALRAEQALRILEGLERALGREECVITMTRRVGERCPRVTLFDFAGERLPFNGVNLTDALSQLVQFTGSVLDELAWHEPGKADAESDVEAFDRVMAGKEAAE